MNRTPRLLRAALAFVCLLYLGSLLSPAALAQTTTITASKLKLGGFLISTGEVIITPVGAYGTPIAFADGTGAQNGPTAFACQIVAGVITGAIGETGTVSGTCQVPDATMTTPANILYSIQVVDQSSGLRTSGQAYTLTQIVGVSGATWALDHYGPPSSTTNIVAVQNVQGTTLPTSCVAPAIYTLYTAGTPNVFAGLYTCVGGVYVSISTSGTASISVGTVAALSPGATPTVTNSGTGATATFNFGIPAGATGATGPQGPTGPTGPQGPAGTGTGASSFSQLTGVATVAQLPAGPSQSVFYASKIAGATGGQAVIPGSSATGDTDSWAALNAITSAGNVDLEVDSGFALSAALNLGSNTTIHCTAPQNGFIMMTAANAPVLQNVHLNAPTTASGTGGYLPSNQTDHDIAVTGCVLNGNSTQAVTGTNHNGAAHAATPGGLFVYGVNFAGVGGTLLLDHNVVYDTGNFAIFGTNLNIFRATNNHIYQPSPLVATKNTDGVHVIGPANQVWVQNNVENCGDDCNAYNADDGNRTGSGDANAAAIATYVKWGPIGDIHDDNNYFAGSYNGIRLLSATENIGSFEASGDHGITCGPTMNISSLSSLGVGNISLVKVHDWMVQTNGTCNVYSAPYNIFSSANVAEEDFSGVQIKDPAVNWPVFTQLSNTIGILSFSGAKLSTQNSTFSNVIALNGGTVRQLSLDGNTWDDPAGNSGSFVSGSVVPGVITASNYNGPNRLLASGFSPAIKNGDAFTNTYVAAATVYVNTTFTEATSGNLAGTTPATCTNGCVGPWVLASGTDFTYANPGVTTSTANGQFDLINTGQTNETIRFSLATCSGSPTNGCAFALRYVDLTHFVAVNIYSGISNEVVIYDVNGTATLVGTSIAGTLTGDYTAVLSGNQLTVTGPTGTVGPVTISNTTGTKAGFTLNSAGTMKVSKFSAGSF